MAAPWVGPHTPALGPDAPAREFSAARALPIVEALASEPRPVGSEAHGRAREYLLDRIAALGLEPLEQRAASERVPGRVLTNLLARVPGSQPSGVLLLCAHYDSVARSPGAGDDAAGVAAALEALRALLARGAARNDVILLLSDGEERGLLGARAFAAEHPWAREVSLVINLDAIGNAGPAALFETGPRNGTVVRSIARAARAPVGGSFAEAIYRAMPNDTDFSVFIERGTPGANLALTGNGRAYHNWFDTPERLDPRGLQHLGELTLDLLAEFGALDLGAARSPRRHFVTLPGGWVLHASAGWTRPFTFAVSVALALAGWSALRGARRAHGRLRPHLARALLLVPSLALLAALAAGLVAAAGLALAGGWSEPAQPTRSWHVSLRLFFATAAGAWLVLAGFATLARGRLRAALDLVPAVTMVAWLALLFLLARTLGDDALPLPALAALPAAAGSATLGRVRTALALYLLSVLLAAQSIQVAIQVSSTAPLQETFAVASITGLGLLLIAPALSRLALGFSKASPSPRSRSRG